MTTAIEADAAAYADAEMARVDTHPSRSDIEVWEKFLGIDSPDIRESFDERLIMKRAGIDEPLFNENDRTDAEGIAKSVYAEFAADQRNPAPVAVDDPDGDKLKAIIVAEAFSRAALRSHFYRQRRDALRSAFYEQQREAEQLRMKRERLAIPATIEGELIPAPRPRPRSR